MNKSRLLAAIALLLGGCASKPEPARLRYPEPPVVRPVLVRVPVKAPRVQSLPDGEIELPPEAEDCLDGVCRPPASK